MDKYQLKKEGSHYYIQLNGSMRLSVCKCKSPKEAHFHIDGKTIKVDEISEKQNGKE